MLPKLLLHCTHPDMIADEVIPVCGRSLDERVAASFAGTPLMARNTMAATRSTAVHRRDEHSEHSSLDVEHDDPLLLTAMGLYV